MTRILVCTGINKRIRDVRDSSSQSSLSLSHFELDVLSKVVPEPIKSKRDSDERLSQGGSQLPLNLLLSLTYEQAVQGLTLRSSYLSSLSLA